jgi:hypothetical protein
VSIKDLKAGDKIKPTRGSTWEYVYKEAEVLAIADAGLERGKVWLRVSERLGSLTHATLDLYAVKGSWDKVEDFYVAGKRYKAAGGSTEYTILEVREVSDPALPADRLVAFAIAKAEDGQYGVALTLANFKHHHEVK